MSPARNKLLPRRTFFRVETNASTCSISAIDSPIGRQSSRILQLAQATFRRLRENVGELMDTVISLASRLSGQSGAPSHALNA